MAATSRFELDTHRDDGRLLLVPRGELDIASAGQMRAALEDRSPGEDVRIDLSELEFLDTSGLQIMVDANRAARAERFELTLVRGQHQVQRVFEMAGLDRLLPFVDPD